MPSSLIGVLQRHCADTDSACPEPSQLTCLADVLDRIRDPRRVRGRRYRLGYLLALCMVAVLGGATSLAAIARFAADTDSNLREQLGLTTSTPNTSTLGRLLARLDGDALDDAVGAWLARYAADPVDEPGDTLVGLAVDGKTVRGSRTDGTAVHLLAAALHTCQTVIAQRQIAAKSNEIPVFAPLLDRIDLRGLVVTAGGHYLLVVKGNQKKLRKQLRHLPWKQIPLQARTTGAGHGRREVRRLKVCTVRPGLLFPHAVQAMEIKRRRTHRKTGKFVYISAAP
ncbi:ISAs1 family transposase [Streptomyces sp. NBC_01538]|uniref:ISAs1 family transposase n=1 Tax=Streptomyces sp. NBC_01538 TaxID=2903897 RepID=UPI0038708B63